jgi:molybdenum cofactor guanylyltransferase
MGEDANGGRGSGLPLGAVLAGGRGSRIGGDKALVELAGRPLISYPLAAVEAAGLEPLVVAKPESRLPKLRCRTIREPARPLHPAVGIVAALRHAGERPLVAVGCDMPFVSPALLAWLASMPESVVVPSVGGRLHPFPGRYEGSARPALEETLRTGTAMHAALAAIRPQPASEADLARFGDPPRLCFNVNSPADLRRAERMLEPTG